MQEGISSWENPPFAGREETIAGSRGIMIEERTVEGKYVGEQSFQLSQIVLHYKFFFAAATSSPNPKEGKSTRNRWVIPPHKVSGKVLGSR